MLRQLHDMRRKDIDSRLLWVDFEYAQELGVEAESEVADEDTVVSFDPSLGDVTVDELRDIGRFYVGADATLANGSEYRGLAYIRAFDQTPYHFEILEDSQSIALPLQQETALQRSLEELLGATGCSRLKEVYPVVISFQIQA